MELKKRIRELSGAALIAVLLGCSMSMILLDSLAVPFSVWQTMLVGVLSAAACVMLLIGKIPALIATLCIGTGTAIYVLRQDNLWGKWKEMLVSLLTALVGGENFVSEHALMLMVVLSVLLTLLAFMLTRLNGGLYPTILFFLFILLGCWFIEKRLTVAYVLPGLIGVAVLYARLHWEDIDYLKVLPAALLAALLAAACLPAGNATWQPLADAAAKVRELFKDYFMFTDPRMVYSVSSDGYQPQGEVLGGPATPRDADVMTVQTDRELLLRGSIRRTYTGYSWVDTSVNSRYLFIDPTRQKFREHVFGVDNASALQEIFQEQVIDVEILNEGTSTLFVPHRLRSLSVPLDLVAYYNDSGEVFITRGVAYGDHYTATAYLIDGDDEQIGRAVNAAASLEDPDYEAVLSAYMNLPAGLDDDVYWLTQALTSDIESPYEKAAAIRDHLLSGEYGYNMDVRYPPKGRDFVSHFLLDTKEGYCTYYASAMAIMARLAGLPSRYVEGYLVHVDPSGETLVRGEDAHAWVEIYFKGVGWIPFDATPGRSHDGQDDPSDQQPQPTPTPEPNEHKGDQQDEPNENEPTPTPEPSPTPEPTTEPESPEPTPEAEQPNDSDEDSDKDSAGMAGWIKWLLWMLLILLIVLALLWLVRRRYLMTTPMALAKRQQTNEVRLMVWYRTLLTLLTKTGFMPKCGETPSAFARRLLENQAAPAQMLELTQAIERQQYAGISTDDAVLKLAERIYRQMLSEMTTGERMKWHMRCMTKGLGNFTQIP